MKLLPKVIYNLIFSKYFLLILIGFTFLVGLKETAFIEKIYAEDNLEQEIKETTNKLEEKNSELNGVKAKANQITAAINKLSGDLSVTNGQINSLKAQINELQADITNLSNKLEIKKKDLDERNKIKNLLLRNIYISEKSNSIAKLLLTEGNISNAAQKTNYYLSFINTSNNLIGQINTTIESYEKDKQEIETIKKDIEKQQEGLKALAAKLANQVAGQKNDLASVSQKQLALEQEKNEIQKKLNELSAKQKELLEEKTESFTTSVGDVPSTGDSHSNPDYDPGFDPAFAAFSFGAPHRQGMSQYGAKGRAEKGQDYKEILKAYYGDVEIKEVDNIPSEIKTDKGTFEFEGKYLKGLAEMPASWPKEALKAQAVAARTYALARIGWRISNPNNGSTICTTEACQVWSSSKASSSSAANWHNAVSSTKHIVLVSKKTGEIFSPLYAATSGGYNYKYSSLGHTTSGGWDTKCGSRSCWTDDAYESIAGSPWFYKGWYKTRDNKSCSRSHPWLNEEEFADIVGALVLYKEDSDNQKHLSQTDAKSCWGKDIGETWSKDKVREKTGIKEIDSVSVSYGSNGETSEVKVKTNKGEYKFSGSDFKAIFNLRAPGAIQIKSSLFNIESK